MIIEYKNYILEQTVHDRFNIKHIVKFKDKKTGETKIREDILAYDVTIETGINEIIFYRLKKKQETTDLKGFIQEFKREKEELINTLKLD